MTANSLCMDRLCNASKFRRLVMVSLRNPRRSGSVPPIEYSNTPSSGRPCLTGGAVATEHFGPVVIHD